MVSSGVDIYSDAWHATPVVVKKWRKSSWEHVCIATQQLVC